MIGRSFTIRTLPESRPVPRHRRDRRRRRGR